MASLIIGSYAKGAGANEEIQLYLSGGGTKTPLTYKWHYISPPVSSLAVSTFAPTYTLDVAQWIENRPTFSLLEGWVAYDGWIYASQAMGGPTFSNLTAAKGYDYFRSSDKTYTFGGQINTGDINANLNYTSGNDDLYGYNLIGNPFTCGLDWDYIITHSYPSNTSKGLYFTRNSQLCSYIAGVGVPGDVTGIIPPMQGFFNKTYSSGNTIILAAAARTHDNIHTTYKGSQLIPLVRLEMTDSVYTDETVVRFDDYAKAYLDNDFDAQKLFLDPDMSSIHTFFDGVKYTINGLPFPGENTIYELPVVINVITDTTIRYFNASQLQGLDNYNVKLTDNSTGIVYNLKTDPFVAFSSEKGIIADRFVLKISNVLTDVILPSSDQAELNIYPANSMINIQALSDKWDGQSGTLKVIEMTGRIVTTASSLEFSRNSLVQIPAPAVKGIYLVEARTGMNRYVGKVVIR